MLAFKLFLKFGIFPNLCSLSVVMLQLDSWRKALKGSIICVIYCFSLRENLGHNLGDYLDYNRLMSKMKEPFLLTF